MNGARYGDKALRELQEANTFHQSFLILLEYSRKVSFLVKAIKAAIDD